MDRAPQSQPTGADRRTIAVVTGTRAEYGLLKPVMRAIAQHEQLHIVVVATGTHLLGENRTLDEIAADFSIDATIEMQRPGEAGRWAEAQALGRGISGFADLFKRLQPNIVLVLGDRIEPFAAASAAAVGGIRVAHIHGGDRAEGIADESMRHAITKLAHIHCPATQISAQRIISMGEEPRRVHVVGSPAIDGLAGIQPLNDQHFAAFGQPQIVVLLHPVGDDEKIEFDRARELIALAQKTGRTLALHPNHDPGRDGIMRALEQSGCPSRSHLPREQFIALLRLARVLVGNSSAGLIEGAAIPIRCVNIGPRQAGREMPANVIDIPQWDYQTIQSALAEALAAPLGPIEYPYGDGQTGSRIAELLARFDQAAYPLAKRNTY